MMAFSRRQFLAGLMACPACASAAGSARAEGAHWSYADPRNWGADGAYPACSIGGEQSPIDLTGAVRAAIEPPALSWQPQAFSIVRWARVRGCDGRARQGQSPQAPAGNIRGDQRLVISRGAIGLEQHANVWWWNPARMRRSQKSCCRVAPTWRHRAARSCSIYS
jgi:hypothetical protein